ncbi:hypothetical protein HMPREF1287_02000 [Corynebacterium sp. KPL1986]|nr:hypothetical protein HMPREF1293_00377 [Corynebacterium sp. KPL1996]ERS45477.1 hypothetical protein HMPREF1287_02000 [Corynebacterium sp. KPL1986]ERS74475.1 hypothetical protein HMPREF1295_00446 [Corynebacterium sp. KPL1998]ERS75931.1 hypothetical protein HMPREF1300_00376 [Corynebacterium sp. KPL2004]
MTVAPSVSASMPTLGHAGNITIPLRKKSNDCPLPPSRVRLCLSRTRTIRTQIGIQMKTNTENHKKLSAFAASAVFALSMASGMQAPAMADSEGNSVELSKAKEVTNRVMESSAPEEAIEKLSSADREAFDKYNTPGDVVVSEAADSGTATRSADYCRKDGVHFEQKALLGNTLYTWWQTVEICGNPGVSIDSVKVIDAGGETKTPTWSYDGHANDPVAYATGNGTWTSKSSETFSQVKLNRRTECITANIVPSGEYNADKTCN